MTVRALVAHEADLTVRTIPGMRSPGFARAGRAVAVLLLTVWFLLPVLPLLGWVFADRWAFPYVLPESLGFRGARAALADGAVPAFASSLSLGLAVCLVATPLGALAARALAFHRVRWSRLVTALLFTPLALPAFAAVIGLNVILLRLQVPSAAGVTLVLAVYALPYTTFTMRLAYGAYDRGFEDEARLLGASGFGLFRRVHLPLIAPALARAAFLAFLVGWSDYLVTTLIGGGQLVTIPLLVASASAGIGNTSMVAVLSVGAVLPPLLLLIGVERVGHRRTGGRS